MPYDKILELVEAKRLDITTVSLAKITADFVEYTRSLEESQIVPALLADFAAVAAQLLLIKSKALLPSLKLTEEEEKDIRELKRRLKLCQKIKNAAACLRRRWQSPQQCFSRQPALLVRGFYPPPHFSCFQLRNAFRLLVNDQERVRAKETRVVKNILVSVEEMMKEIQRRFTDGAANQKFYCLIAQRSRREAIALFLAVLHLLNKGQLEARQGRIFGEIIISQTAGGAQKDKV